MLKFLKAYFETILILYIMCALLFENARLVLTISILLFKFLVVEKEFLFSIDNMKNFLFAHCMLNDFIILLLEGFIILHISRAAKQAGEETAFYDTG